jgi:hypothetical protein
MSIGRQSLYAWGIGLAALLAARLVADWLIVISGVAGLWLLFVAVQLLTDDRTIPGRPKLRFGLGLACFAAGAGWLFGGLIGLLSAIGVEAA